MRKLLLFLLFSTLLHSNSYALIVGVNNYRLKGAVNDANAMATLMRSQKVKTTLLLNKNATRANILRHLKRIVSKLNNGDRFYFFFSGHGTSLLDPNFKMLINNDKRVISLLENSGGLIPWDYREDNAYNRLLSAKRDLAPIFREIDKRKRVFAMVMIDACFSGMNFKDFNTNIRKSIPIKTKLHFTDDGYPYQNILYLASSTMSDWSLEDTSHKPYRGFFSRALEHCLYRHNGVDALKRCINAYPMAQSTVVYAKNRRVSLFKPNYFNNHYKDIVVTPRAKPLIEELFGMARGESDLEMIATQRNGVERKVYTPTTPLELRLKGSKEGYLVFMSFDSSKKLKLHYPKYEPRKVIKNDEFLGEFEAKEPFGEEYLIAFLVDFKTSKKIIEIYKRNQGNLESDASIREVIGLIKGFSGCSLVLKSTK